METGVRLHGHILTPLYPAAPNRPRHICKMDNNRGAEIWGKNWADAPARLQEDLQEFGRLAAAGRTWAEARDLLVETATSKDGHVCQDGECSRTSARTRS